MKSPQRSHHVCVVGPAGWKRWPRPGTCCWDGLRAVHGAMRRALARSSRVRPGPMRPAGASSRSSMSSGSADMARSGRGSTGLDAGGRGRRAGRRFGTAPRIKAGRREKSGGERNGNRGELTVWTCGRGGAQGWALPKSPFPVFQSSLHLPSPGPSDDCKAPHGCIHFTSPFYSDKGRGSPHPALAYAPPTLPASLLMLRPSSVLCAFAGWGRK